MLHMNLPETLHRAVLNRGMGNNVRKTGFEDDVLLLFSG